MFYVFTSVNVFFTILLNDNISYLLTIRHLLLSSSGLTLPKIVNLRHVNIRNWIKDSSNTYIGRFHPIIGFSSPWANPHKMLHDVDRLSVVSKFQDTLINNDHLLNSGVPSPTFEWLLTLDAGVCPSYVMDILYLTYLRICSFPYARPFCSLPYSSIINFTSKP